AIDLDELPCQHPADVIGAFNDEPGRTADQVIGMLHTAATLWETDPAALDDTDLDDQHRADQDPGTEPDEPACTCAVVADRQVIAVWATDGDEPASARIFTPDQYADWAETNYLIGAFGWPQRFYAVTGDGQLAELGCTGQRGDYDEDDYAQVTYHFTLLGHAR